MRFEGNPDDSCGNGAGRGDVDQAGRGWIRSAQVLAYARTAAEDEGVRKVVRLSRTRQSMRRMSRVTRMGLHGLTN